MDKSVKITLGIGMVIIVVIALFFGKTIIFGDLAINPRQDIVTIEGSAKILKQDASERAIVLIARQNGSEVPIYSTCAEPPPDALQEITKSLDATIKIAAKNNALGDSQLATKLSSDLRSATQILSQRSQGIQLLRDSMFRLCEAFQNGVLKSEEYSRLIESLIITATFIIPNEQCSKNTDYKLEHTTTEFQKKIADIEIRKSELCFKSAVEFNSRFLEYSQNIRAAKFSLDQEAERSEAKSELSGHN